MSSNGMLSVVVAVSVFPAGVPECAHDAAMHRAARHAVVDDKTSLDLRVECMVVVGAVVSWLRMKRHPYFARLLGREDKLIPHFDVHDATWVEQGLCKAVCTIHAGHFDQADDTGASANC